MSIKKLLLLFIILSLPIAGTITFTAILLNEATREVGMAQYRRFTSYSLAEELLRSSEMLTRFARTYVATGDKSYRDYYNLVLEIRNGTIPLPPNYGPVYWFLVADSMVPPPSREGRGVSLDNRMQEAGITVREFALLKDAQSKSDVLVRTEDEAMDIVEKLSSSGNTAWRSHPDHLYAIELMHDRNYHSAKASIMEPIGQFLDELNKRSSAEVEVLEGKADRFLNILLTASALMLLNFLLFSYLIYKRLLIRGKRLLDGIKSITAGHLSTRVGDMGKDELGLLANAIDGMTVQLAGALSATREQLDESKAMTEYVSMQKEHSEKLLYNMLPVLIADRLKRGESQIAETFPEVTVLFADIVGFTEMSTTLPPRQLVNLLNDIFSSFDELADRFHLEKIKTIGDCYMVVGGVPDRSPTHCQQVADFALEAVKSIRAYSRANQLDLHIRIGIHTGTVVAGVVGKRKYSYDLWGDVVNTASRMESFGVEDRIHITEAVKVRLSDDYDFEARGPVELKGKGTMATFYLIGKKAGR